MFGLVGPVPFSAGKLSWLQAVTNSQRSYEWSFPVRKQPLVRRFFQAVTNCNQFQLFHPVSSGISILWPQEGNKEFKDEQFKADAGDSFNNISPILLYQIENGPSFLWMGDMEKDFLVKIKDKIPWPNVDVLFAPHHGRDSGKVPQEILRQIKPQLIIIGEADSDHLNYYSGWNTLTQISAGDITFRNDGALTDVYCSLYTYDPDIAILKDLGNYDTEYGNYLGTFRARQ